MRAPLRGMTGNIIVAILYLVVAVCGLSVVAIGEPETGRSMSASSTGTLSHTEESQTGRKMTLPARFTPWISSAYAADRGGPEEASMVDAPGTSDAAADAPSDAESESSGASLKQGSVAVTELNILTYNVFMRPAPVSWPDRNRCRARAIAERFLSEEPAHDIIALNESFDLNAMQILADQVAPRYPHQILRQPGPRGLAVNGGVSILSRYPIEKWRAVPFKACSGRFNDCLATKGFVWAKVKVSPDLKINILATHLNSGGSKKARAVRRSQLDQIRKFIDTEASTAHWPTLLLGDLNINGLRWEPRHPRRDRLTEYARTMEFLGQTCQTCEDDACLQACQAYPQDVFHADQGPWSYDIEGTRAANTYHCISESISPCVSPNRSEFWRRRMRIDYILNFGPPRDAPDRVLDLSAATTREFADDACQTTFLSDHRAVQARFSLPKPALNASEESGPAVDEHSEDPARQRPRAERDESKSLPHSE